MRRFVRAGLVLLVMLAGIVLPTTAAQACSCGFGTPVKQLKWADAVFLGQVVERELNRGEQVPKNVLPVGAQRTYTFDVERVYKGKVDVDQRVSAGTSGAACGIPLNGGETYLVFGTEENVLGVKAAPGEYTTYLCSGTKRAVTAPAVYGEGELPRGAPPEESSPASSAGPLEPAVATSPSGTPGWVLVGALVLAGLALVGGGIQLLRRRNS